MTSGLEFSFYCYRIRREVGLVQQNNYFETASCQLNLSIMLEFETCIAFYLIPRVYTVWRHVCIIYVCTLYSECMS